MIDGETGVFFDELSVESLNKAIKKFKRIKLDSEACRKQAEKFGNDKFNKEIRKLVKDSPKDSFKVQE